MTSKFLTLSILASSALLTTPTFAEEVTLDPIVVSSDFREKKLSETSNTVSVIGEEELYDKSSKAFEDVVGQTPNVNFTAGASRAHYIQIRGIGERSQFISPVNPSVGIMLDGIDFSQSALGITMFDIKQIEVLKGPQGTTFGANGMAGVVNITSNEPSEELEGHVEATVGNYNTRAVGVAIGGTLIKDTLEGRLSIYKNKSDGYMKNSFLNRDDTQDIDELTIKTQLRWYQSDNHTVDFNFIHVDVDNGYDAFTLDNSRDSHADNPGKDTQKTDAFSLKSTYQVNNAMHLVSSVSYSTSDLEYSYDEDWSFAGEFAAGLFPYNYFDQYLRSRIQKDVDVRLVSDESGRIFNETTDWTVGVYYKDYSDKLTRNRTKEGVLGVFSSQYHTKSKAIYGQLNTDLNDVLRLTTGLRIEKWESKYTDSDALAINTDEVLYGGKIGLEYTANVNHLYYVTLSKGYKPGGVNADNTIPVSDREYTTETLWNLDLGVNSHYYDNKVVSRFNLFYGKRKDQQVKKYIELSRSFTDYLDNAAEGTYYGLESQLDFYPNESLHIFTSLGLLKSEFDKYSPELTGRAPAQSPKYQYNVGFDVTFADGWIFKSNVEGKGSYYFSNTHDQKSDSYALLNSSLEYTHGSWSAVFWGRNITNTEYQTRGFFFGNDPSTGYAAALYTQQGTPRTFGVTVAYDF
jgi:outer membrane receptor protein involved in Fe transport